jgi:hypothetical protein
VRHHARLRLAPHLLVVRLLPKHPLPQMLLLVLLHKPKLPHRPPHQHPHLPRHLLLKYFMT